MKHNRMWPVNQYPIPHCGMKGPEVNIKHKNKRATGWILFYEGLGFFCVLLLIWANEIPDLPALLFGMEATPVNWIELLLESFGVTFLAVIVITMTARHLKRIQYLEGFLKICASCKKIHIDNEWIMFEQYIGDKTGAVFSHGYCPECAEKYFEEGIQAEEKRSTGKFMKRR